MFASAIDENNKDNNQKKYNDESYLAKLEQLREKVLAIYQLYDSNEGYKNELHKEYRKKEELSNKLNQDILNPLVEVLSIYEDLKKARIISEDAIKNIEYHLTTHAIVTIAFEKLIYYPELQEQYENALLKNSPREFETFKLNFERSKISLNHSLRSDYYRSIFVPSLILSIVFIGVPLLFLNLAVAAVDKLITVYRLNSIDKKISKIENECKESIDRTKADLDNKIKTDPVAFRNQSFFNLAKPLHEPSHKFLTSVASDMLKSQRNTA